MPFTAEELTGWVGGLGLADDKKALVLEALGNPTVIQKVGDSVLAQREFSRKLDELKANETRLNAEHQARMKKEDEFQKSLSGWKTTKEQEYQTKLQQERQATEQALTTVRDRMKTLGTNYGIPEEELKPLLEAKVNVNDPPVVRTDQRRDDDGKFLPRDEFNKVVNDYAKLPAIMQAITYEHQQLFPNQPPPDFLKMIDEAGANKRSLKQEWEVQYKVGERRDAIHEEQIQARIKKDVEAAVVAERSRILADNPNVNARVRSESREGSPILHAAVERTQELIKAGKLPAPDVNKHDGVSAAVAAFNEGKYQPGKAA